MRVYNKNKTKTEKDKKHIKQILWKVITVVYEVFQYRCMVARWRRYSVVVCQYIAPTGYGRPNEGAACLISFCIVICETCPCTYQNKVSAINGSGGNCEKRRVSEFCRPLFYTTRQKLHTGMY